MFRWGRSGTAVAAAAGIGMAGLVGALGVAPADAAGTGSPYTYEAFTYGTLIGGGSLPASSGRSAYAVVACTSVAGRQARNTVTGIDLDGLDVGAVTSNSRSYRTGGTYHAASVNTIASITAGSDSGPRLTITGLRSVSHAWHSSTGYHSALSYTGKIGLTATPGGPTVPLQFPEDGRTLTVPGVGTVYSGLKTLRRGPGYASASGYALRLHLDASGSNVWLGHTLAQIRRKAPAGIFSGRAYGSEVHALGGAVTSGPSALAMLSCNGTGGRVLHSSTASVTVPEVVHVGATISRVRGAGTRTGVGDAWTRSNVAEATLGTGQAVIRGVHANAHVHRTAGGRVTEDVRGTTPGTVTVGSRTTALPVHGRLVIPGVASISTRVVSRTATSIRVTAVRVQLLSGTAAGTTIDLGNARAGIARR